MRLENYDYSTAGAYFITICTQNRRCILSRIVGTGGLAAARSRSGSDNTPVLSFKTLTPLRYPDCPHPELTKYGQIADRYIKQLHDFYPHLSVEEYVIMPNHIHLLLWVKENENAIENGQSRTPVPTNIERANSVCSQFVSTFKRFCNKEYGENIWQARFYDHVIRNREDYEEHARYIRDNPDRWYYDELYQAE